MIADEGIEGGAGSGGEYFAFVTGAYTSCHPNRTRCSDLREAKLVAVETEGSNQDPFLFGMSFWYLDE
jgi:hypothetical protein